MLKFKYIGLVIDILFILTMKCSCSNVGPLSSVVISNTRQELATITNTIKTINSNLAILELMKLQRNCSHTRTDVAFQATLVKSISTTQGRHSTVVFDHVDINEGNGYSVKTGKFTAPRDGIYVFHWTCMTHTEKVFRTELAVNGKRKVGNHAASRVKPADDHDTGSQTYVGRLSKDDQVWIRTFAGETYLRGDGWSAFSGYIL